MNPVWLCPTLPLLLAALYLWPRLRPWLHWLTPWAALPALLLALLAPQAGWHAPWLLLGASWGLTELTRPFLAFTALIWFCAGLYALGYLPRHDRRLQRFYLAWLLTLAGNLILILARDVASFYTGFALMTFAAYGLIVHSGSAEALRAGRVYLGMAVLGEGLLLGGLLLACGEAAEPQLAALPGAIAGAQRPGLILALLIGGFGIKAGLPLLHLWLPLAHPVAPTPASAVLSGSMIKAGLLGWLQCLPLGEPGFAGWGALMLIAGLFGAFGAALVGVAQERPKAVLAYSSISQMGLMTILLGAALLVPGQWPTLAAATVLYTVHHGLAKGALFLGVGVAERLGRRQPHAVWMGVLWPALALAGLPFTSGAVAKAAMKTGLHVEAAHLAPWWEMLPLLLSFGALATTLLMLRFFWLLRRDFAEQPASSWLLGGWVLAVLASAGGIWWLPLMAQSVRWPDMDIAAAVASLWPIFLALGLAAVARLLRLRMPSIPAGDVLLPLQSAGRALAAGARRLAVGLPELERRSARSLLRVQEGLFRLAARTRHWEGLWLREGALACGVLLLLLILALRLG